MRADHLAGLSLRLLAREWRAGELRVLAAGLVVAVGALTAVDFFTGRMERAMAGGANELLGADLMVTGTDPLPEEFAHRARNLGLATARTVSLRSVVVAGERFQLAAVKAVGAGYPLRGRLEISDTLFGAGAPTRELPAPGRAWADARLAGALGLALGDTLELGHLALELEQVLSFEPDRGGDVFNIAPRLLVSLADLPATRLLQPGSRARYRLLVAGEEDTLAAFRAWLAPRLAPNQRLQGIRDARPEIRAALARASDFLALAALAAVLMAGTGIAVAARRHAERHLDTAALMRCLGAERRTVLGLYCGQLLGLGVLAGLAGGLVGYAAQAGLTRAMGSLVLADLPAASWTPLASGTATGLVILLGFAVPPLFQLVRVPPARVLRRELGPPPLGALALYGCGLAAFSALLAWRIDDGELLAWVLGYSALIVGGLATMAWALVRALAGMRSRVGVSWRFGLASIARHRGASVLQVVSFGLGLAMILLLALVRGQLLEGWRASLPVGAPNYFLINVQPHEVDAVARFLAEGGREAAALHPMVRGRLVRIGEREVTPEDDQEAHRTSHEEAHRARHLDRDFNLSWAARPAPDNRIVEGAWWDASEHGTPQISVEQGIAETLGFALGDELTFLVAGREIRGRITSVRTVQWDSFNVNFFVVFPPGVIDTMPATYITSFHLPPDERSLLTSLVRRFPSITVLDVDALLVKVREIMERAALGVEYVFLFTLAAGLIVLYAAVQATLDERRREAALLRTLGADRRRIVRGLQAEFVVLGLVSGILAALAATVLGGVVADQILAIEYRPDPRVWLAGLVGGGLLVGIAGYLGTRSVLRTPPATTLREG